MRIRSLATGAALIALGVPAVAGADTGTSGNLQLRLDIGVRPAESGTSTVPRSAAFDFDQTLGTVDGARPSQAVRRITITLPRGFRLNLAAFPQCTLSAVIEDGFSSCPRGSKIGTGSATADARPALADLIPARVTAYAGIEDLDIEDRPRTPVPAVIVKAVAQVSGVTVNTLLSARIKRRRLIVEFPAGSGGGAAEPYIIRDLKLTLRNRRAADGTPLVQTPTYCGRSWRFAQTTSFADGTFVTARDNVPCTRPGD